MNSTVPVIRRSRATDAEAFGEALGAVARERRYLATVEKFPLERTMAFLQEIEDDDLPQVVATASDRIVGWCDIIPKKSVGYTHVGNLGMGVIKDWRSRGLGRRLIADCLVLARERGLEKVELTVYADNVPAIRLYQWAGFLREGLRLAARKLDGAYQDEVLMGLRF